MSRVLSRFKNSLSRARRQGSFAPEFALLAPPFFLLMMGLVEMALMLGAQQMLENAAFNASRLGKTGYVASEMTQEQTINQVFTRELSSYGSLLDPARLIVTVESYETFTSAAEGSGSNNYGGQEQIVTYAVTYPWKVFTPLMCAALAGKCQPDGTLNLNTRIVVRNEPYG